MFLWLGQRDPSQPPTFSSVCPEIPSQHRTRRSRPEGSDSFLMVAHSVAPRRSLRRHIAETTRNTSCAAVCEAVQPHARKYVEVGRLWQAQITICQQGADLRSRCGTPEGVELTEQAHVISQRSAGGPAPLKAARPKISAADPAREAPDRDRPPLANSISRKARCRPKASSPRRVSRSASSSSSQLDGWSRHQGVSAKQ